MLQPLIDSLMAKDPADRPADSTTAAKLINDALVALPPPGATGTVPIPALTPEAVPSPGS
jgi:hypothetical protein